MRITVKPAVRNARKCATQNASKPPVMGSSLDGETRPLTAVRVDTHNDCKAAVAGVQVPRFW
jgi:hypothetical protein